jgi:hypothetical protein
MPKQSVGHDWPAYARQIPDRLLQPFGVAADRSRAGHIIERQMVPRLRPA